MKNSFGSTSFLGLKFALSGAHNYTGRVGGRCRAAAAAPVGERVRTGDATWNGRVPGSVRTAERRELRATASGLRP
jgi:hypothetical protein